MSDNQMLYAVENNVATITFNRPEQQNTISGSMLNRLSELLLEADADTEVRAIIITGSGKFFARAWICVGATSPTTLPRTDLRPL